MLGTICRTTQGTALELCILRFVLEFSPYRCVDGGRAFSCERQTKQSPPLLVNVVLAGGLDGIDSWILSLPLSSIPLRACDVFLIPPVRSWPRPPSSNSSSPGRVPPRLTANVHTAQANTKRLLATPGQLRPFSDFSLLRGGSLIVRLHHPSFCLSCAALQARKSQV